MSDFPNSTMCKLIGGAMNGQHVPISKDINRIEMYAKGGVLIAYVRVNKNTFKAAK